MSRPSYTIIPYTLEPDVASVASAPSVTSRNSCSTVAVPPRAGTVTWATNPGYQSCPCRNNVHVPDGSR